MRANPRRPLAVAADGGPAAGYIAASELDAGGARETERNENETGRAWRSTICVGAAQGRFPPAIRLSARAVRWIEADVMEWLRERVAEGQGDAEAVVH